MVGVKKVIAAVMILAGLVLGAYLFMYTESPRSEGLIILATVLVCWGFGIGALSGGSH